MHNGKGRKSAFPQSDILIQKKTFTNPGKGLLLSVQQMGLQLVYIKH